MTTADTVDGVLTEAEQSKPALADLTANVNALYDQLFPGLRLQRDPDLYENLEIKTSAVDGYYEFVVGNNFKIRSRARPNIEALDILGANLEMMVGIDRTSSTGSAVNYLGRIHVVETDGRYETHHQAECDEDHPTLLHIRREKKSPEFHDTLSSIVDRISREQQKQTAQAHEYANSMRAEIKNRIEVTHDVSVPDYYTWMYYQNAQADTVTGNASDLTEVHRFLELFIDKQRAGKPVGYSTMLDEFSFGRHAASRILQYAGLLDSVSKINFASSRYDYLFARLEKTPLTPIELHGLLGGAVGIHTLHKRFSQIKSQKKPNFPLQERAVPNYLMAAQVYEALDVFDSDIDSVVELTKLDESKVLEIQAARPEAEPHIEAIRTVRQLVVDDKVTSYRIKTAMKPFSRRKFMWSAVADEHLHDMWQAGYDLKSISNELGPTEAAITSHARVIKNHLADGHEMAASLDSQFTSLSLSNAEIHRVINLITTNPDITWVRLSDVEQGMHDLIHRAGGLPSVKEYVLQRSVRMHKPKPEYITALAHSVHAEVSHSISHNPKLYFASTTLTQLGVIDLTQENLEATVSIYMEAHQPNISNRNMIPEPNYGQKVVEAVVDTAKKTLTYFADGEFDETTYPHVTISYLLDEMVPTTTKTDRFRSLRRFSEGMTYQDVARAEHNLPPDAVVDGNLYHQVKVSSLRVMKRVRDAIQRPENYMSNYYTFMRTQILNATDTPLVHALVVPPQHSTGS